MASVKKGFLTGPAERWSHLGVVSRHFWKGERRAGKKEIVRQRAEFGTQTHSAEEGEAAFGEMDAALDGFEA